MIKPNTFIVGSAKSGTTSLYEYLKKTDNVFFPEVKEPGYLASTTNSVFANSEEEYLSLYKSADNEVVIGDASTAYLYDKESPKLIHKFSGTEAKILIILRNPIDMAYSLWRHRVREDAEGLSFEEAIYAWDKRKNDIEFHNKMKGWLYNYNYLGRAKYYNQVQRYLELFDNVLIIVYEKFISNERLEYENICSFLNVDPNKDLTFKVHNKHGKYKKGLLYKLIIGQNKFKNVFKNYIPISKRTYIREKTKEFIKEEVDYLKLDDGLKSKLVSELKDDVKNLNESLDIDLKTYWPEYF